MMPRQDLTSPEWCEEQTNFLNQTTARFAKPTSDPEEQCRPLTDRFSKLRSDYTGCPSAEINGQGKQSEDKDDVLNWAWISLFHSGNPIRL